MNWLKRLLGTKPPKAPDPAPIWPAGWVPTHRHRKGGLYRLRFYATLEIDRSAVAVYDDAAGKVWVRPTVEFEDGRFTPLFAQNAEQ